MGQNSGHSNVTVAIEAEAPAPCHATGQDIMTTLGNVSTLPLV